MTDGRTDRQTDRILIARPRLHCMQRGKKPGRMKPNVISSLKTCSLTLTKNRKPPIFILWLSEVKYCPTSSLPLQAVTIPPSPMIDVSTSEKVAETPVISSLSHNVVELLELLASSLSHNVAELLVITSLTKLFSVTAVGMLLSG